MPKARRLGMTQRVDLSPIADGWTDECYAVVTRCTTDERFKFAELKAEKLTHRAAVKFQNDFVKAHFVSGKIMVVADSGNLELADMVPEDIDAYIEISDALFTGITGVVYDPKGSSAASQPESKQPEPSSNSATTS